MFITLRQEREFKVNEYATNFTIFTKGNNFCDFLFTSIEYLALSKWDLLVKEKKFLLKKSNFLPLGVVPYKKGKQK